LSELSDRHGVKPKRWDSLNITHQQVYQLYKFEVILTVHRRYYVEIKCQLDATDDIY